MEKYTKIIEFLNSSDPETVIIGLQYLKESDIKIFRPVFTDEKNIAQVCDKIINNIKHNYYINNWEMVLDIAMDAIISDNPSLIELHKYKSRVLKIRSLLKLNKDI